MAEQQQAVKELARGRVWERERDADGLTWPEGKQVLWMITKGVAQARKADGMQLSCWQHDLCDYINQIRGRALSALWTELWSWVAFSGSLNVNFWLAEDIVAAHQTLSCCARVASLANQRVTQSWILNPLCRTSACNPLCERLMPKKKKTRKNLCP